MPPPRRGVLLAPADGRVVSVTAAPPPPELGLGAVPRWRVGIFLSVLDVHVNRVPADGTVTRIAYRHGTFLNASLDKASAENERNALAIRLPDGREIAVVQIAGLVARRIVCEVREGDAVHAGERFGIIRFGSRTDLYLPEGVRPLVAEGQIMIGGETVIADLAGDDAPARARPRALPLPVRRLRRPPAPARRPRFRGLVLQPDDPQPADHARPLRRADRDAVRAGGPLRGGSGGDHGRRPRSTASTAGSPGC